MSLLFLLCGGLLADLTTQSSIDDVLDALDARGRDLKSFTMNVSKAESNPATGDATIRTGKAWYEVAADGSVRIRVTFDKKNADGKISDDKIEYLLAGTDLVDRAYRSRTQTTSRVLKPGEKVDLFKLGEGPFPLPLGQKKESVHANFEVSKIEPKNDDPKNSVHVRLVPKPNTRLEKKFKSIDVWVDLKQHMPARVETLDRSEAAVNTVDFADVQVNPALKDADFTLPPIGSDWNRIDKDFNAN